MMVSVLVWVVIIALALMAVGSAFSAVLMAVETVKERRKEPDVALVFGIAAVMMAGVAAGLALAAIALWRSL